MECCGDLRVCRKRTGGRSERVDRKLDLLVHELQRYGVSIAGVQESKWFGVDVWTAADGYTFLHSGRPLPGSADVATRNEGVGILLDARASEAWRPGGEIWEGVSSRVVMARLKWISRGQRKREGGRERSDVFVFACDVCICPHCQGSYMGEGKVQW